MGALRLTAQKLWHPGICSVDISAGEFNLCRTFPRVKEHLCCQSQSTRGNVRAFINIKGCRHREVPTVVQGAMAKRDGWEWEEILGL